MYKLLIFPKNLIIIKNAHMEKEKLPKRCERFKINALKACEGMEDSTICKNIIYDMTNQCNEWLKQQKKDEYSITKKPNFSSSPEDPTVKTLR